MAEDRSVPTKVVERAIDIRKNLFKKAKPVAAPLMMKKATADQMRNSWPNMTPQQRQTYIRQVGLDKAFETIRGKPSA